MLTCIILFSYSICFIIVNISINITNYQQYKTKIDNSFLKGFNKIFFISTVNSKILKNEKCYYHAIQSYAYIYSNSKKTLWNITKIIFSLCIFNFNNNVFMEYSHYTDPSPLNDKDVNRFSHIYYYLLTGKETKELKYIINDRKYFASYYEIPAFSKITGNDNVVDNEEKKYNYSVDYGYLDKLSFKVDFCYDDFFVLFVNACPNLENIRDFFTCFNTMQEVKRFLYDLDNFQKSLKVVYQSHTQNIPLQWLFNIYITDEMLDKG